MNTYVYDTRAWYTARNKVSQYPVNGPELHWIACNSAVVSSEPIQFSIHT